MSPLNQITLTDIQMGRVAAVMREANVSFDDAIDMIFKANTTFNHAAPTADRIKMYNEHNLKIHTDVSLHDFLQMSDEEVAAIIGSIKLHVPKPETPGNAEDTGTTDVKTDAWDGTLMRNWANEQIRKVQDNLKNSSGVARSILETLLGDAKVDWDPTKEPNSRAAELIRIIETMWNHDSLLSLENFPCRCGKPDCLSELRAEHHQRLQEAFKAGGKKQWKKTLIEILEQLHDDANSKKD